MTTYQIIKKLNSDTLDLVDDDYQIIDTEPVAYKIGETKEMAEQRIASFYERCRLLNLDDQFWKGEK